MIAHEDHARTMTLRQQDRERDEEMPVNSLSERLAYWASRRPTAPFLIDAASGTTLTYEQTFRAIQTLQHAWGDTPHCIWLALDAGAANAIIWLSALLGGHALVPVAPQATASEIQQIAQQF